jgi:hypothetical protein
MNEAMSQLHAKMTVWIDEYMVRQGCPEKAAFSAAFRWLAKTAPKTAAAYSRWLAETAK